MQQKIDYIKDIDFSKIIDKMVAHQGWRRDEALEACHYYRNYLILNVKNPDKPLPPTEDVDEFWHLHILDTQKYRKDCESLFGYYLNHYPYFGIDEKTDMNDVSNAFEEMQNLHVKEFGERVPPIRISFRKFFNQNFTWRKQ